MDRTALITGASGMDGELLAKDLIRDGYVVHGTTRSVGRGGSVRWHEVDLLDYRQVERLVRDVAPDEIYNLAAFTSPISSFDRSSEVFRANLLAVDVLLSAVLDAYPSARVFQASTARVFEGCSVSPQNEQSVRSPKTPYSIAKNAADDLVMAYRKNHGLYVCSGILYNHDAPMNRPFLANVLAKKVAKFAACPRNEAVTVFDADAVVDLGYAGDYVRGFHRMLRQECPRDMVLATGVSTTVRDLAQMIGESLGLRFGDVPVVSTKRGSLVPLVGDASLARSTLGWRPRVGIDELAKMLGSYWRDRWNL